MRHLKSGRKLKRTSTHKLALLRNLATSLFEHKKIHTTEAKAKELRPFAERLITKAKDALANEKQGKLPEGQTIDIHSRRLVGRHIRRKAVLQELFDSIAPVVIDRNGGYTRITKTGLRRGDAGEAAIIELVDWSAKQDGVGGSKKKKKAAPAATAKKKTTRTKKAKTEETVAPAEVVAEAPVEVVEEVVAEAEVVEETAVVETAPVEAVAEETTVEDAPASEITNEAETSSEEGEANTEEKAAE